MILRTKFVKSIYSSNLARSYKEMVQNDIRECEANEWSESLIEDNNELLIKGGNDFDKNEWTW